MMDLKDDSPPKKTDTKKPKSGVDPTRSSRSLAIALVVAAVFLLAAAGVIMWLVTSRSHSVVGNSITHTTPSDDTKNVTKVSFVPPATLPAQYLKNDQSTRQESLMYYYDDTQNCGFTTQVRPIPTGKIITDVIATTTDTIAGVTTAKSTQGSSYTIKDTNGTAYTFDSVDLAQDVKVDGVAFTQQNKTIVFKQFGAQAAELMYGCKTETWPSKKAELADIAKTFTVKTER